MNVADLGKIYMLVHESRHNMLTAHSALSEQAKRVSHDVYAVALYPQEDFTGGV
ncbi:hypothetical protein ABT300_37445 [Streptomyces sp. NPDC001027]|uniref:hypothetical protein n=1 Tax=Streptomyces sp. NPDC001027 TaxID=3154771 RepID=UPI00331DE842